MTKTLPTDMSHIYIRLKRPEGYEDVHADLVIEDSGIKASFQPSDVTEEINSLKRVLRELVSLVRGECPSLLDEDSGGNSRLAIAIDAAIREQT